MTALTLSLLLGASLRGLGTEISVLVTQNQYYSILYVAIEKSISLPEESLFSLAEVVFQNRKGLDLLFLQQGGLCEALGEECCFFTDHLGITKDNMATIREGLARQKREHEARVVVNLV